MKTHADNFKVEIIADDYAFQNLRDDWNNLLRNSNSNNIFLTHEWLYTWWKYFKKDGKPSIILVKEGCKILGIAPLYSIRLRHLGLTPCASLAFLGSHNACAGNLDFIILKGREPETIDIMLDTIFESSLGVKWELLSLFSVSENSGNLELIRLYCENRKIKFETYNTNQNLYINLSRTFEEYFKTLSRDKRNKFRRYKKHLSGQFEVALVDSIDKNNLDKNFDCFINLHQKRWNKKGEDGSFSLKRTNFNDFHREIVHQFFEKKWLQLSFLEVKDEIVSGQYNYIYNNVLYNYSIGFNPDWYEQRVGTILQLLVIEKCFAMGFTEFDFLRGEEAYKFSWTKTVRKNFDIVIYKDKVTYSKIRFEKFIRKIGKSILPNKIAREGKRCFQV